MKKIILLALIAFVTASVKAQKFQEVKDFLSNCKYEIIVGYSGTSASEPYENPKFGYNLGVTARKEIVSYMDNKVGVYGLTGLIFTRRAGKTDNDFFSLSDDDKNLSIAALSLPIHVGAEYKFKKVSLFADLGPNVLFKTGSVATENFSTNSVTIGGGFNLGLRFKKFALGFGYDLDFTNIGKFTPSYSQQNELKLDKGSYDIKTIEAHFVLRWTL